MASKELIDRISIFYRDGWHCRLCLQPVFLRQALKHFAELAPGHGYYLPGSKRGEFVEILRRLQASAIPGKGESQRITSCEHCSGGVRPGAKAVTSELRAQKWDGFAALYASFSGADADVVEAIRLATEEAAS